MNETPEIARIAADRALQDARHLEELAAYELTCANLRAQPERQSQCDCRKMGDPDQCDERAGCRAIAHFKRGAAKQDRHTLQAEGKHPAPCDRHCQAEAFEIEIRRLLGDLARATAPPDRHLERPGLGAAGAYATAEETGSVMRKATPYELWLEEQLNRIHPQRHEIGSAGDMPAMTILVHQLKQAQTRLEGEAAVMRSLLEECLKVLHTLDPEDDSEGRRLESLKRKIVAVVEAQLVQR